MGSMGLVVAVVRPVKASAEILRPGLHDVAGMTTGQVRTEVDGVWVVTMHRVSRVIDACCLVTFSAYPELAGTCWTPQPPPVTGDPFPSARLVPIAAVRIITALDRVPDTVTLHARGPVLSKSGFVEDEQTINVRCGQRIHFLGATTVRLDLSSLKQDVEGVPVVTASAGEAPETAQGRVLWTEP
jgi:hypothetical protein